MKIENKTNYLTSDLRKLFTRCVRADEKIEGKLFTYRGEKLTVTVTHSKSLYRVSGKAVINGYHLWMHLPHNMQHVTINQIVFIFVHELAHIRGYRHKDINDYVIRQFTDKMLEKDAGMLREKPAKAPKAKSDIQVQRYEHVLVMVTKKEKQLKRLQKQLTKWTQKRKYYERVLTSAGKLPSREN